MPSFSRFLGALLLAVALLVSPLASAPPPAPGTAATRSPRAALCPIVYPVDQSASDRGVHFLFYGNGFFINKDGYLITAAHVLSQLHGGQPYVLLRSLTAPPRILPARLVAIDIEHDIAILRATPNPFLGNYDVSFLPLSADWPEKSASVTAAALRPSNLKDPHTGDPILENDPSGEVIDYEFFALYKGKPETELLLFSHEIEPGQSGAPILAAGSDGVVGLVEGRWLRENATTFSVAASSPSAGIGAGVPIHYAIWLLQQKGITWQPVPGNSSSGAPPDGQKIPATMPVPLSLVTAPYPADSLTGGEVVLDTVVDPQGRFAEIRVIRGEDPFLFDVLAAVRTWTFIPAHENGHAVFSRLAIAFQFPQSLSRVVPDSTHTYDEPAARDGERAALPVVTVEPQPAPETTAEGSVILYDTVDARGGVTSTSVLQSVAPLTPVALAAARQWRFVPGMHAGAPQGSAAILVFTFRRSPLPVRDHPPSSKE